MNLTDLLHFAIPCWIINMSLNGLYVTKLIFPRFAKYDKPLDNGLEFLGKPLLGQSTTWPGIIVALVVGVILSQLMQFPLSHGLLYGLGVYFGHASGSFIKRRLGFSPGKHLPVLDHGNYVLLTGLIFTLAKLIPWQIALYTWLITLIVHPVVTFLAYKLKLKKYPL